MRVVLQGSLHHFAARELLTFLATVQSGTFDAESGGQRLRVALRGGQVVWAEGDGDALGVLAKLLAWTDGTFTFLDEIALPEGVSPLSLELASAISQAEEWMAEERRMANLFPDDGLRFRVVNRPPGEINITAEEFQLLFQIGTGKSLAQLRADSGRPAADLYPIVKRLQMTGLIEPAAGDPEDTAPRLKTAQRPAPETAPPPAAAIPSPAPPPPAPAPETPAPVPETPPAATQPERKATKASVKAATKSVPKSSPEPVVAPEGTAVARAHDLVATLTEDAGTMHPLLEETSTIGRTGSNTIALPDSSVSARHARVVRTAEGFTIEDVGSRNGTFVNSEKLSEKRLLVEGDLVRLGKIILTFNLAADLHQKQSTQRGPLDS
jgi:pSer/pThr/pTyr-binding forkhead associated (FHA) protein